MKEHLGFLKISSAVVKVAAWIFLLAGVVTTIYISLGLIPGVSSVQAFVNLIVSVFFFFFLYIIAKIADLLVKIIHEIHEIKKE